MSGRPHGAPEAPSRGPRSVPDVTSPSHRRPFHLLLATPDSAKAHTLASRRTSWRAVFVLLIIAVPIAVATAGGRGQVGWHRHGSSGPSASPLASLRLYASAHNKAAEQASIWSAAGDTSDAAAIRRIAINPAARWLAGGQDPRATAAALVAAAGAAGAVAQIVLYYIPARDCQSYSSGGASDKAAYLAWVQKVAQGIGGHPAIVVLEPDAVNQAADGCLPAPVADERYPLLSRAVTILKSAPRLHVYLDAGNAGWLTPRRVADPLRRAGVARADGFALNVANFQTTRASIAYGRSISRRLGGRHFVIDTSRNGNGPPSTQNGVDHWCNPRGRALGLPPTTRTGVPLVDAYLWVKYPGDSDGACHAGEPPAGTWWPAYALQLARGGR